MPFKDPQKRKEYHKSYNKEWYSQNKAKILQRNKINKSQYKKEWIEFKSNQSCTECGLSHPAVIDFHHFKKDPQNQKVNELIARGCYKKAYKEAKNNCIPLCANCHRIHHWNEKEGATE